MKSTFPIPLGSTSVEIETLDPKFNSATPPPNQVPIANAGGDKTVTLPTNFVDLQGSATDPDTDGVVTSYLWTKISGPGVVDSPNQKNTRVSSLVKGTSEFEFTAIDNLGARGSDRTLVFINDATPPPTTGYQETFATGYDKDSDMLYGGNGQYGAGQISKTFFKTGPGSFYSKPADVSNGTRSEVQYTDAAQNPTEGAIEYDVYYEVIIPNQGCSIQWHPNTEGGSGSPFLAHESGKFVWNNWKNGSNEKHPTGITIPLKKWVHMRMEYKFGTKGQGAYWKHWMDNVLICSWQDQVGDGSGQYLKVGYNGWDPNSKNSRIYFDNLKVFKKI